MRTRAWHSGRVLLAVVSTLAAACASPPPEPRAPAGEVQVAQIFSVARRAYALGDFAQARALYQEALTRARAMDHAALAADAAYNLAVSEIALKNYEAADRLLLAATDDASRASSDIAEPTLLRAKVAYLRGRYADALALCNELVGAAPALHRQALLLRGLIRAESGDLAGARLDLRTATQAGGVASEGLPPSQAADARKLEGTIALREGDGHAAARLFDSEADLLRVAQRYADMAHALSRAAAAYSMTGNSAQAARRYFLAARSLLGQGDVTAASSYVASSLDAAVRTGDSGLVERARALQEEITKRDAP